MSAKRIPIAAAKRVADEYGYQQVVVVARAIGDDGGEHVTTYGVDKAHCDVAARIGDFFKHKLMGWPQKQQSEADVALTASRERCKALEGALREIAERAELVADSVNLHNAMDASTRIMREIAGAARALLRQGEGERT